MKTFKILTSSLVAAMALSLTACGPELDEQLDAQPEVPVEDPSNVEAQALNCTYGSTRRVPVANSSELRQALSNALPGDDIVLASNTYSLSGGFSITRDGTADRPITIRAASALGAVLRSSFEIHADHVTLAGVEVINAQVVLDGTASRLTRSRLRDLDGIAVLVSGGTRPRVDHNELVGMKGRGISVNASQGVRNPRIDRNFLHDWVGPLNENVHEGVQLGMSQDDSNVSLFATLEYNLFRNVGVDQETVSVKSSNNTVRFNTLLSSRNITNRHGEDNVYTANWFEASEGINIHDQNNELRANRCVDCKFGFRVMAGGTSPTSIETSPAPYALNTRLTGNNGPVIVGFGHGNNGLDQLPRGTTIDRGHVGTIRTVGGASFTRFDASGSLPFASRLSTSQVGVGSGSCAD
jgi:hypothetical protein